MTSLSPTAQLQKLSIRLFFSQALQARWGEAPRAVAWEFGVPEEWINYLPDVGAANFKAESWGRRLMIAREVHLRFSKAIAWTLCEGDATAFAQGATFSRFLDSEDFFAPRVSIPHPYGLRAGYENVTKFFDWFVREEGLQRPFLPGTRRRKTAIRRKFYGAYGVHLMSVALHSSTPFYTRIGAGVYFKEAPGDRSRWQMIESDLSVTRLAGDAAPILEREGLVDIDSLLAV